MIGTPIWLGDKSSVCTRVIERLYANSAELNAAGQYAYDHAVSAVGRPADEVALVAVHAFDCHGAHGAGLTTGWAARLERHYAEIFTPADVIGDDLVDVASALIALPEH